MSIRSKRSLEGVLLIDHRNSPGVSPSDIGGAEIAGVGSRMWEGPTATCCHCNAIVAINPLRNRPRNSCLKCDRYVCDNPICNSGCSPFKALLDKLQEDAIKKEQMQKGTIYLPPSF